MASAPDNPPAPTADEQPAANAAARDSQQLTAEQKKEKSEQEKQAKKAAKAEKKKKNKALQNVGESVAPPIEPAVPLANDAIKNDASAAAATVLMNLVENETDATSPKRKKRLTRDELIAKGNAEAKAGEDARTFRDYEERSAAIAAQAARMRKLIQSVQFLQQTRDSLVTEFFKTDDELRDLEHVKHTLDEEILTFERKLQVYPTDEGDEAATKVDEQQTFALTPKLLDDANERNESLIDELHADKAAWHEQRRVKLSQLDDRKREARLRKKRVAHDTQQLESLLAQRNSNDAQLREFMRESATLQNYVQIHGSKWLDMLGSPEDFLDRLALNRHIFLLRKRLEQQRQATLALYEAFESDSELRRLQLERSCTTMFELVAQARLKQFTNSVAVATRGAINYVFKRSLPLLQQEFVEQQISCIQDESETERRNLDVFTARLRVEHLKLMHKLWTAKVQLHAMQRRKEHKQAAKIAHVLRMVEKNQPSSSESPSDDEEKIAKQQKQDYYDRRREKLMQAAIDTAVSDEFDENERLINDVLKRRIRVVDDDVLGVDDVARNVLGANEDDDEDPDWIPNIHGSQDSD